MTILFHLRQQKRGLWIASAAALSLVLSGCHKQAHVAAPPLPPPPPTSVIAVPPPTHVTPDATLEEPPAPVEVVPVPPKPKPKPRPVQPKPAQPAPVVPPPPIVSIGTLSSSGDVSQETRDQTAALLTGLHNRVNAIAANVANAHHDQMERVRNFLKQADDAWKSGDVEGARTLATKAKVLLDDIQR